MEELSKFSSKNFSWNMDKRNYEIYSPSQLLLLFFFSCGVLILEGLYIFFFLVWPSFMDGTHSQNFCFVFPTLGCEASSFVNDYKNLFVYVFMCVLEVVKHSVCMHACVCIVWGNKALQDSNYPGKCITFRMWGKVIWKEIFIG